MEELHWAFILFLSYLSILLPVSKLVIFSGVGARLYPICCLKLPRPFRAYAPSLEYDNFLYSFQIHEWPFTWYITSSIIVSFINWCHVGSWLTNKDTRNQVHRLTCSKIPEPVLFILKLNWRFKFIIIHVYILTKETNRWGILSFFTYSWKLYLFPCRESSLRSW